MTELATTSTPTILPSDTPDVVRKIAHTLNEQGEKSIFADSLGKKVTNAQYLAIMLWDLIVNGEAIFADGTPMPVLEHKEWLATIKFIASHVEGVARPDTSGGLNIYKIYVGIDTERV